MIFNYNRLYLFENCQPVKGTSNSIICDLQRKDYSYIPNELYDLITEYNGRKTKELLHVYDTETLVEYFNFLIKQEYVHIGNYKNYFPKINLDYHEPSEISHCIIDLLNDFDLNYLQKLANQLEEFRCKNLEIRFYGSMTIQLVCEFLDFLEKNQLFLISIGLVFSNKNASIKLEDMEQLLIDYPRIAYFIVFESEKNQFISPVRSNRTGYIVLINKTLGSSKICGNICQEYFVCNIENFIESLNYNSCLNKKIAIDIEGNIKNCPSMIQSFGNIKDTTLENALNHSEFKKYWNLTKDNIEVCKDCEFRYICTDCRAYTELTHTSNEGLDVSKPLKCGYNPYTGEWQEWSTNPLKQKAIQQYGMQELIRK